MLCFSVYLTLFLSQKNTKKRLQALGKMGYRKNLSVFFD